MFSHSKVPDQRWADTDLLPIKSRRRVMTTLDNLRIFIRKKEVRCTTIGMFNCFIYAKCIHPF